MADPKRKIQPPSPTLDDASRSADTDRSQLGMSMSGSESENNQLRKPAAIPKTVGRFEIRAVVGEGAFGRVYRAFDPDLQREVAIKVPLSGALSNQEKKVRFLREARAAAALHHPNICPVYEIGAVQEQPFIVMGFVPGATLAAVLRARNVPLPFRQAASLLRKIALAVSAAHAKGVIHRDLKPGNILIDRERKEPVVTDFGLAMLAQENVGTNAQTGKVVGTPSYMSPEQARGEQDQVTIQTDVYSLGVILFELLTLEVPFRGSTIQVLGMHINAERPKPSKLQTDVDPRLDEIVLRAMAKNPAERYANAKELADALDNFLRVTSTTNSPSKPILETSAIPHEVDVELISNQPAYALPPSFFPQSAVPHYDPLQYAEEPARTSRYRQPAQRQKRTLVILLALLACASLLAVGLLIGFVNTSSSDKVEVQMKVEEKLDDKSLAFALDGKVIPGESLSRPILLPAGEHELVITRGTELVRRYQIIARLGEKSSVIASDPKSKAAVNSQTNNNQKGSKSDNTSSPDPNSTKQPNTSATESSAPPIVPKKTPTSTILSNNPWGLTSWNGAPFSWRKGATWDQLLKMGGGNRITEESTDKGLNWLEKRQLSNGSWQFDGQSKEDTIAATGMVLMAFLGTGHAPGDSGPYSATVRKGIQYLINSQVISTGSFITQKSCTMYTHGIATIALCEASAMCSDATEQKRIETAAKRAIEFIEKAQGPDGSWSYTGSNDNGDTSILGWQLQVYRAAKIARIPVNDAIWKKSLSFLGSVYNTKTGSYSYRGTPTSGTPTLTAIGELGRIYLENGEPNTLSKSFIITSSTTSQHLNLYGLYYISDLLIRHGGDDWETWNNKWVRSLTQEQNNNGSWSPDKGMIGMHCGSVGTTAMAVLILETYYRYPIMK